MTLNELVILAYEKGYRINGGGQVVGLRGNILKPAVSKKRWGQYPYFNAGGVRIGQRRVYVHRLVAYQKFGDRLFGDGIQVRHLDGDPGNNRPSNIEIGSASDNQMDKSPEVRRKLAISASRRTRRFSDEQVSEILKDRLGGMTYRQLQGKYGASKGTLSYLFNHSQYAKRLEGE